MGIDIPVTKIETVSVTMIGLLFSDKGITARIKFIDEGVDIYARAE